MNDSFEITAKEQALLSSLSPQSENLLSTLIEWSHLNSGSHNCSGLGAMRDILRLYIEKNLTGDLREVPLKSSEVVDNFGAVRENQYEPALVLTVRPKADIQLVLTGHYDTVFPRDSHFQTTTMIDQDTLGGPGVADMKGGILVMINALRLFEQHANAHRVGYTILLSPDEETGSHGSSPLLMQYGKQSHIGLTFEPALADGSMAGARKGSGNFSVVINGRAAHAGREHHLGRNAIAAMARFGAKLDDLNGMRDGVTFNLAKIDGGGAVNIVPETAIGRFNVRLKHEADQVWILDNINTLLADINEQDGLNAHLHGGFTRPPKPMAPANELVFNWVKQAGNALGQHISWKDSGGVCEGNNLWASGCPNVDTLGVRGGEIHSDREFMKISSLVERTQLSALILMQIANGTFDVRRAKALVGAKAEE